MPSPKHDYRDVIHEFVLIDPQELCAALRTTGQGGISVQADLLRRRSRRTSSLGSEVVDSGVAGCLSEEGSKRSFVGERSEDGGLNVCQ